MDDGGGASTEDKIRRRFGADVAAKLQQIDLEVRALHRRGIKSYGLRPDEIGRAAEPLWQYAAEGLRRKRRWIGLTWLGVATLVGLVAILYFCDPAYRLVCACARILSLKTLPYWDWTKYYNEECLLRNPYHDAGPDELFEEDCKVCEDIDTIGRISNVSQLTASDTYIKRDIPVVVTDATEDWPARKLFSLKFLHELYETEDILRREPPCIFVSNIRQDNFNVQSLLQKSVHNKMSNWYAHWENCEKSTVRLMRRFYRRPYFLPPMVEVIDRNWMFLSTGYKAKTYKPVDISSPLMWLAQLHGENKIRLIPRHPCNATCSVLYTVLHEGDTIMWTDFMWLLDYLPHSVDDRLNVALGFGGSFD